MVTFTVTWVKETSMLRKESVQSPDAAAPAPGLRKRAELAPGGSAYLPINIRISSYTRTFSFHSTSDTTSASVEQHISNITITQKVKNMASNNTNNAIPVNSSTSGWEPTVQDQINLALASNGGIKRIEAVMQQRLDEAGWTQNLREYVTKLLRSGEATTYDDCLTKVMAAVNPKEGANGVNGTTAGTEGTIQVPDLKMPEDAAQDSAVAVAREIKPLLEEKK